jgi:hypothetical protein
LVAGEVGLRRFQPRLNRGRGRFVGPDVENDSHELCERLIEPLPTEAFNV